MKIRRKRTGGKYHKSRKKKAYEVKRQEMLTKLGEKKIKKIRVKAGKIKTILLSENIANVMGKDKKTKKAKIIRVIETPSNRFLARQNLLVKSAVIETELGKARITNRPSQEGNIQATLIEE